MADARRRARAAVAALLLAPLLLLQPCSAAVPTAVLSTTLVRAHDTGAKEVTLGPWVNFMTGLSAGAGDAGQVLDNPIVCDLDELGSKMLKDPPLVRIDDPCAPTASCQRSTAQMTFTPSPNIGTIIKLPATAGVECTVEDSNGEQLKLYWNITMYGENSGPTASINGGAGWSPGSQTLGGVYEDNSPQPRSVNISTSLERSTSTVTLAGFFEVSPSNTDEKRAVEAYQNVVTTCEVVSGPKIFLEKPVMRSIVGSTKQDLSFILARDMSGEAEVMCTHTDADVSNPSFAQVLGGSVQTGFRIAVTEVNDPPIATVLKPAVVANENSQLSQMVITGVLRVLPGPEGASENAVQTVCGTSGPCDCTTSDPSLFERGVQARADGSIAFTPAAYQAGKTEVSCAIKDNGSPPLQTMATFSLEITENNDPPRATVAGIDVLTDVFPYLAASTSEIGQTIAGVTCASTQANELFTVGGRPTITVAPSSGGVGTLKFTLAPDANTDRSGDATVTCTISDSVSPPATKVVSFKLRVRAVNDPPTVTLQSALIVVEAGTRRTVDNFLKAGPGPVNEADQLPLTYACATPNQGLFAGGEPPAISDTGTLAFATADAAAGDALVSCTVSDAGPACPAPTNPCGNTGGCPPCSTTVNFTLRVQNTNAPPSFTLLNGGVISVPTAGRTEAISALGSLMAGPAAEQQQGQRVVTRCDRPSNASHFSSAGLPTLGTDGVLRFTTVPGASGRATVRCVLSDSVVPPATSEVTFTIVVGSGVSSGGPNPICSLSRSPFVVTAPIGVPTEANTFMSIAPGGTGAAQQQLRVACAPVSRDLFRYPDHAVGLQEGVGEDPVAIRLSGFLVSATVITAGLGTSEVRCTVTDGTGSSTVCSFTVVSTASGSGGTGVNGVPVATARCPVASAGRASGPQTVPAYLALSPGVGEDQTQRVVGISCTASPASLFSATGMPSVEVGTGTLRFTPSGQAGSGTVVCTSTDNGNPAATSQVAFGIALVETWDGRQCPAGVSTAPPAQSGNSAPCSPNTCRAAASPVSASCGTGTTTRTNFISNLSPGPATESWQAVSTSCTNTRPDLFATAGMPVIDTLGTLRFTPATGATGSATVQCTVTDTGSPVRTSSFSFDVQVSCTGGAQSCLVSDWSAWSTCDRSCGGGSQTRTRTVTRQPSAGGAACPTLVESQTCNAQACSGATDCVVSAWGAWGPCSAACGTGQQIRTRTVVANPSGGGAACPALQETRSCNTQACGTTGTTTSRGSSGQWLRMVFRRPIEAFRRKAFEEAVQNSISGTILSLSLMWVCPDTACPGLACPSTNSLRASSGCLDASQVFWEGRRASLLQLNSQSGDEHVVDFDLPWTGDSSLSVQQARARAATELGAAVTSCNSGSTCHFAGMNPVSASVAGATVDGNPATATTVNRNNIASSDGDDGLSTAALIGIIIAALVLLCLIILLIYCLVCHKSKKSKDKELDEPREGEEGYGPHSQHPSQYHSQHGSQYRSQQYDPAGSQYVSKTQPAELTSPPSGVGSMRGSILDYQPGQPVNARYGGDGQFYPATIHGRDPEGTYTVNWEDGTHSPGVAPTDLQPA
eukprot:TRINITY_DN3979_c0_g2_i1.p1 TRINITY_DN3979_c0_g2~~TRINITY_DN3979_c0_g2_i1.p1  ORF type:complete len:1586 (+),score=449.87 TRINITY_DN3979_c0_g2_i1:111-4868(+)